MTSTNRWRTIFREAGDGDATSGQGEHGNVGSIL